MPSENNAIVSVQNLSVRRNGREIISNIHADIAAGEIAAVIGPNGAGKSTLIQAILGLLPYSGTVRILGRNPRESLRDIGYVPQRFSFDNKNFPLTVLEFLRLSAHPGADIPLALREVEMEHNQHRKLGELSGGQLQRVLIAQAIVNQPKLLVLDEPTSGIDLEGEKDFYEIIRHQNQDHGVTVLMVSHEVNMVYAYATQVICLNKNLFCFGRPKDAITKEVLEKLYGSDVSMTEHHHHHA